MNRSELKKEKFRFIWHVMLGILIFLIIVAATDFYFWENSKQIYYEKGFWALFSDSLRTLAAVAKL